MENSDDGKKSNINGHDCDRDISMAGVHCGPGKCTEVNSIKWFRNGNHIF